MRIFTMCFLLCAATGCGLYSPSKDRYDRFSRGGFYSSGLAFDNDLDCLVISSPASGRGDLWRISCDGKWAKPVFETPDNEVDPNSGTEGILYFARSIDGRYQIFSRNLATNVEAVVVSMSDSVTKPVASPDGTCLMFVRKPNGDPVSLSEIWQKNLLTGHFSRITDNLVYDGSVSFFRDSRRIVYYSDSDSEDIFVMDLTTRERKLICNGSLPSLSDDEESILFVRRRAPSYNYDLWKREIESGDEQSFEWEGGGGSVIQAVQCLPGGRVAVICDLIPDRVGRLAILDTTTGEWISLPRLMNVVNLPEKIE